MNARNALFAALIAATTTLTACGAGAGTSVAPSPANGGGTTPQSQSQSPAQDSVAAANAVGAPVSDIKDADASADSPLQNQTRSAQNRILAQGNGTCTNGVEFFAPDKNGDANSTERIVFYDNGCTAMQEDAVRIYTSTGPNAENVERTVKRYALNANGTPSSVNTQSVVFINSSFDQYGYPVIADGFNRAHSGALDYNGEKTIVDGGELVFTVPNGATTTFCGDSAGYNATGLNGLTDTTGRAGIMATGTRTVNSDGSITWSTIHTGATYTGSVGSLSLGAGVQNTSCPVQTPMYTLQGGTQAGTFNIPVSVTFSNGIISNLTVTDASLANGDTLNVQTNSGVAPSDEHFISGTLTNAGSTVSTFNVNAFGDGVLIVASSGQQYQMEDWKVVK